MRLRTTMVVALTALSTTAPAQAGTPAPSPRIADGVTAGGLDVSGLTVIQAALKLRAANAKHLMRPLSLRVAGRTFHLTMAGAGFALNATATAKLALAAQPTPPNHGGGTVAGSNVQLVIKHSHFNVATFVDAVSRQVTAQPRNATLRIGLQRMHVRRARHGHTLAVAATTDLIDQTLNDLRASRHLHVAVVRLRPQVNANDLAHSNPTIITVDRAHFVLRLFKHLKLATSYPIAVGRAGLETPTGIYHVQDKQVNPSWHVPNSPWAGALAGHVIPPGPNDPIVARWMGLADGVGIHGTDEPWTVGSAASHGCIRMRVPDVIALFDRVTVGAPVLIA